MNSPRLRIVSLAPSITEMLCALGLADQLVGRTSYCEYPPEIAAVPKVGALVDLNVEQLLSLAPDLILAVTHGRLQTDRLRRVGLQCEAIPDTTLEDIYAGLRRIGELTGRSQTAERVCRGIREDVADLVRRCSGARKRVLLLTSVMADPPAAPFVAGPGSLYDDLLRLAGHENVAPPGFAPLSLEAILAADPDAIIELDPDGRSRPDGDAEGLRIWSKIGPLKAVREKRVHVLVGPQHYLAGPRVAETLEALCAAISPG